MSTRDLIALITSTGKTVEQAAQSLGVDVRVLYNVAKGYQPMPRALCDDLAGFLGISVEEVEYACPSIAVNTLSLFTLKNANQLPFDPTKLMPAGGYVINSLTQGMLKTMGGGITLSGDVSGPSDSNTVDKWKNVTLDITTMSAPPNASVPIYNSTSVSWKAINLSQDISLLNNGAVTVIGLQGRGLASTAPSTGQAIVWNGTQWAPGTPALASGVSPGTAGQVYITNGTPAATWTSLISVELTHGRFTSGGSGTDFKIVLGAQPTNEANAATIHALPSGTAATLGNYCFAGTASDTYFNAVSATGVMYFMTAGSNYQAVIDASQKRFFLGAANTAAAPFVVDWATLNQTQFFAGSAQNSLLIATTKAGATIVLQPDNATTAATVSLTGIKLKASAGYLLANNGGLDDWQGTAAVSLFDANNYRLWMVSSGVLHTTNTTLQFETASATQIIHAASTTAAGQSLTIQAQSTSFAGGAGGDLNLYAGAPGAGGAAATIHIGDDKLTNVTVGWNATGTTNVQGGILYLQSSGGGGSIYAYAVAFNFISSGGYQTSWNTNQGRWLYDERSSSAGWTLAGLTATSGDVAAKNFTVTTQAPFATAVTNLTAGDFLVNVPTSVSTGFKYGGLQVTYGNVTSGALVMGVYAGQAANAFNGWALWMNNGLPASATNYSLYGDSANTIVNAPTSLSLRIANAVYVTVASSLVTYATPIVMPGANPAATGDIRFANNRTYLAARNAGNTADVSLISLDASNNLLFGDANNASLTDLRGFVVSVTTVNNTFNIRDSNGVAQATFTTNTAGGPRSVTLGLSTGGIGFVGAASYTVRTVSTASFTFDTTTTDKTVKFTVTCAATLPAATAGRDIDLIIDNSGGAGPITVTITRVATEQINAQGANFLITAQVGDVQGWKLRCVDGTNWYCFPG